jgi:chromosome segregation ATPase
MPDDVGSLRQQIGETLGTVRSLAETVKEIKQDAERREDRLTSEIRTMKHEQRQSDQVITSKMELLTAQFRELDSKSRNITEELALVKRSVAEMELPVKKMKALQERIMIYTLAIASVGGAIWWLISPFLSDLIHRLFSSK